MRMREIILETTSAKDVLIIKKYLLDNIEKQLVEDINTEFDLVYKTYRNRKLATVPGLRSDFYENPSIYLTMINSAVGDGLRIAISQSAKTIANHKIDEYLKKQSLSNRFKSIPSIRSTRGDGYMAVDPTDGLFFLISPKVLEDLEKPIIDFLYKKLSIEHDPTHFKLVKSDRKGNEYLPRMSHKQFKKRLLSEIKNMIEELKRSELINKICEGILHEIVHIQQFNKIKIPFHKLRNALNRVCKGVGLDYYSCYLEIDAYANDFVAHLILNSGGLKIDYSEILKNIDKVAYSRFSKKYVQSHEPKFKPHIEKIFQRFIRKVVKNINDYNDFIGSSVSQDTNI